jgi:hypothetical protein
MPSRTKRLSRLREKKVHQLVRFPFHSLGKCLEKTGHHLAQTSMSRPELFRGHPRQPGLYLCAPPRDGQVTTGLVTVGQPEHPGRTASPTPMLGRIVECERAVEVRLAFRNFPGTQQGYSHEAMRNHQRNRCS